MTSGPQDLSLSILSTTRCLSFLQTCPHRAPPPTPVQLAASLGPVGATLDATHPPHPWTSPSLSPHSSVRQPCAPEKQTSHGTVSGDNCEIIQGRSRSAHQTLGRREKGPSESTSPEPRNVTLLGNSIFADVKHVRTRSSWIRAGPKPDLRTAALLFLVHSVGPYLMSL